jgi:hypothetical protein
MREEWILKNHIATFEMDDSNMPVIRAIHITFKPEESSRMRMCDLATSALITFASNIEKEYDYEPIHIERYDHYFPDIILNIYAEDKNLFEWYTEDLYEYVQAAINALTNVGPLD